MLRANNSRKKSLLLNSYLAITAQMVLTRPFHSAYKVQYPTFILHALYAKVFIVNN
ncbi:hypothetical protein HYE28_01130 [Mycoplasmopsis bovis]|nr:hypothetical protein [Mycoplasmopsis bovis]QQH22976.1 hypothetical protein HYE28_01130 [Mycoplasmopsis bovis]